MMPSEPDLARAQRLHPSSILFHIGSTVRSFVVPIILLLVFSRRGSSYEYWYIFGLIPVTIGFVARYISFRYWLRPEELVIRDGILTRNERHIPYGRIQNIDLMRNPVHRLFGVAEARIETASGGKPEAVIRVLSTAAIDEMRARVFRIDSEPIESTFLPGEPATEEVEPVVALASPPQTPLVELPLREVVLFGLLSNRGMVVVLAFLGIASQAGFYDFDWSRLEPLASGFLGPLPGLFENRAAVVVLIGLGFTLLVAILMRLLSVGLAIFKLHGFRLTLGGNDLRAEYGLLTRISQTVPTHRIQLLLTRETRLHRWFKRCAIEVETAGGGGGIDEAGQAKRGSETQWLAPIYPIGRAEELIRRVLPELELSDLQWQPLEARAWKRPFRRAVLLVLLLMLVSLVPVIGLGRSWVWALPGLLLPPLLVLPWVGLHSKRWIAATGYALAPHAVVFRSGWWGRQTASVRFAKIQAVQWTQSPFDRRHRMASVRVDTAGAGRVGQRISIPYLDEQIARRLADRLTHEADRRGFSW